MYSQKFEVPETGEPLAKVEATRFSSAMPPFSHHLRSSHIRAVRGSNLRLYAGAAFN